MIRIDSHQHFWKTSRGDYGWLTPELDPLYRDFLPADLRPLLEQHGIDETVLVQAAPTVAETEFLLEIANETPWVRGVVGWIDFESDRGIGDLARLSRNRKLLGVRPMVQDLPEVDWLSRPSHAPVFDALVKHDLAFDALVLPPHLPHAIVVAKRHPELSIVIDHAAKPTLRDGIDRDWFENMATLASLPNTTCKLSGLVTEAREDWTPGDLVPVVDHLLSEFGSDRLLWGSDWPVVTLAAEYDTWWETSRNLLSRLSATDREAIFGGVAARIYSRPERP